VQRLSDQLNSLREQGELEIAELCRNYDNTQRAEDQQLEELKKQIEDEGASSEQMMAEMKEKHDREYLAYEQSQRAEIDALTQPVAELHQKQEEQRIRHEMVVQQQHAAY
jgi:hypothetical protein